MIKRGVFSPSLLPPPFFLFHGTAVDITTRVQWKIWSVVGRIISKCSRIRRPTTGPAIRWSSRSRRGWSTRRSPRASSVVYCSSLSRSSSAYARWRFAISGRDENRRKVGLRRCETRHSVLYICILDLYPFESGTWARGPLLFLNFSIRFRCRFTFHSPIIIIIKNWEGMCFVGKEKRGKKGPGNAGAGRKQPGQPEPLTHLT